MKEILNNQEIPVPDGLEERLSKLIDRLEAEEDSPLTLPVREGVECIEQSSALQSSKVTTPSLKGRVRVGAIFAIAAAFVAVAFLLIVPQVRQRRELARYEGSYTLVGGERIDDLGRIRADINEALAMAQVAEANVPVSNFASEAEHAILHATDDPEMQAVVQRILNDE